MKRQYILSTMKQHPVMETERLMLRFLLPNDWKDLYEYARIPEVSLYQLWEPHRTAAYTRRYLRDLQKLYEHGEYFEWGVVEKKTGKLIGTCGFSQFDFLTNSGELGYSFSPSIWGQGYAREATQAVLKYGFHTLNLNKITALCVRENLASIHVLEHLHMAYKGEASPMIIKGQKRRICRYEITSDEYLRFTEQS